MEIAFITIYVMNIPAQSAMATEIFIQIIIFLVTFASDHICQGYISIQLSTRALNCAIKLSTFIESYKMSKNLLILLMHKFFL